MAPEEISVIASCRFKGGVYLKPDVLGAVVDLLCVLSR
jgi:hypothetical protein